MFCLEAFLAQTEADVTNAIADFMDCSIVIPPTDIQDPEMLKPIINYQRRLLCDRLRPADARLAYGDRVKGQQDLRGTKQRHFPLLSFRCCKPNDQLCSFFFLPDS